MRLSMTSTRDLLQGLTVAETLFVPGAYCYVRLQTCTVKSEPSCRQKKMQGNTIAFAQDAASLLLDTLPMPLEELSNYLVVYFTDASYEVTRQMKAFTVRRDKVRTALLWLRSHNPFYAAISIDESTPAPQISFCSSPCSWIYAAESASEPPRIACER